MISYYLYCLFDNCKLISKKNSYNKVFVRKFFENGINLFAVNANCANEKDLLFKIKSGAIGYYDKLMQGSNLLQIFYLINSIGEIKDSLASVDELSRFRYTNSLQKNIGITENLVLDLMIKEINQTELKNVYAINNHRSYFFLSHDIDSLYGSFKQDGLWALKQGRPDILLKLFVDLIMAKPAWFNIDYIMDLENEHSFKSTFFWLVNRGKIDARQSNSDYDITSAKVKATINNVEKREFENGLHKSISKEDFKEELRKLPVKVISNRYHYLKFNLPQGYKDIENSGLQLDASLGFAEHYGFRNSYGYPFHPFNFEQEKPFSFLEVPLNIMDGTFQRYMNLPVHKTADTIIAFLESNRKNCLLSILWHNTFFTNYKYKGYLKEYKKILLYLYENKFQNINQSEILLTFKWKM